VTRARRSIARRAPNSKRIAPVLESIQATRSTPWHSSTRVARASQDGEGASRRELTSIPRQGADPLEQGPPVTPGTSGATLKPGSSTASSPVPRFLPGFRFILRPLVSVLAYKPLQPFALWS
jgi:hypothetical protein